LFNIAVRDGGLRFEVFGELAFRPVGAPLEGVRHRKNAGLNTGGKKMKGEAPNMSSKEMAQIRQNLEGTPDIEEAAELMNLAGNSTRLKLLYLLENMKELCVCDLAEMLGVSVSAVSQHLAKLKAYGLVAPRRDAQTIYYRLTDHEFNAKLRDNFFKQFQV
jgi:DNA-binding transcriptional ArsR family regulator